MTANRTSDPDVLDASELREAIFALASVDLIRLRRAGRIYSLGLGCDVDDLMGDAITAALAGRRRCPRTMDLVPFLVGVMRSRASGLRKAAMRSGTTVSIDHYTRSPGRELQTGDANPEQLVLKDRDEQDAVQILEGLFRDDPLGLAVLQADLADRTKEEIMANLALDATAYATVRRRMRRRINAHFPGGSNDVV